MKPDFHCSFATLVVLTSLFVPGKVDLISPVEAADSGKEDQPPVVKLVLNPVAEPRPALRYHLIPPLLDRRPGNAAVIYGKVKAEQRTFFGNSELQEKIAEWPATPLAEFPIEEARKVLQGTSLHFLEKGARCEYVDWQLPIRDEVFYSILLPQVQESRSFARMLAAKVRLHVAEGQFDEAVHTLQTGYALGRHVGQGPTIINGLVGIAIVGIMSKQVETFVQQPGAPNLYWALTNLPDPLIDMRPGFEAEWAMIYLSFPELRDLDAKQYSPDRWRELVHKVVKLLPGFGGGMPESSHELLATGLAVMGYPRAKQGLIERGYSPDEVEAMPTPKVVLMDTMQTYEELRDDLFKWFATPPWVARRGFEEAKQKLRDARRREVIPIASVFLPAIQAAHLAGARGRRTIAVLRVIEAVRLYGAAHDGNLPQKLSEITRVPIPIDPVTGQPFGYRKTGNTALLEAFPPPGRSAEHYGLRYEISFAPKGK